MSEVAATPSSPVGSEAAGDSSSGSSPSSSSLGEPSSGGGEPEFSFDSIFGESSGSLEPAATPAQVQQTPAVAAVPAGVEPAAQPQATPAQAVPQEPSTTAPQSPGPIDQGQPLFDPSDPMSLAGALVQNRAVVEAEVARQLFTLSPEEIDGLETNAVEMVPKLLARTYVAAQTAMLQQMGRLMPAMMERQQQQSQRYRTNEAKFYDRWKGLSPEKHGAIVTRYATVLRQANPQLTLEQMIEQLGPLVHQVTGVPIGAPQTSAAHPPAAFAPAMAGAVGHPQPVDPGDFAFMGGLE